MQKTPILILFIWFTLTVSAQIKVSEMGDVIKVQSLVKNYFLGDGIQLTNISFKGHPEAIGTFTDANRITGFSKGLLLSTGRVELIAGNNSRPNSN